MNYTNIPDEMKQLPNWILWKLEDRSGPKPTKSPYSVSGRLAKTNDPRTWTTFDKALEAFQSGQYNGLGFVFTGTPFVGIDIDGCIDPLLSSEIDPAALNVVNTLNSYTELSPSGRGLHIIMEGKLPEGRRRNGAFEMYGEGSARYFTVTGEVWGETREIRADQGAIDAVHAKYIQVEKKNTTSITGTVTQTLSDAQVQKIMARVASGQKSEHAQKLKRLLDGDTTGYKSDSEADQAFSNYLASYCSKDIAQMERVFNASPLGKREKWVNREDYRKRTLEKAVADCTWVYDPNHKQQKARDEFTDVRYEINDLPSYVPDDNTDTGNSRVFAKSANGRLIWTDGDGFRRWNGLYWELNPNAGLGMGKAHTDRMLDEAGEILGEIRERKTALLLEVPDPNADEVKKAMAEVEAEEERACAYYSFVLKTRNKQRTEAFVNLAKPDILIPAEKLNADPFLLNTPAGMIDLRTGAIRPHDPMEYCTAITAVSPATDGGELWWEHLRTITCDSPDLMRFHQEVAGMALIGRVYMENLLIELGDGSNGKSTHNNVQLMVLGPGYAGTINPEVLTADKRNAGADLATLKGKRLVIAAELEEGKRLSTSILKRLTSTDPITAERKYFDPESFTPTHSTILYTNHVPRLGSMDNGTKRRIKIVPFDARIPASSEKKNYTQELFETAGGAVLSWMIEGAQMFIKNGFILLPCAEVAGATQKYFEDNDWITPFLEECCIVEPGRRCAGGTLYQAYSTRAEREGEYVRRNNDFARELERLGFWKEKTRTVTEWHGLAIRASAQSGYGFSVYPSN